ncbi:hypothetical protein NCS52_01098400 [Fusarium sp. LHS14.1]|nr:hypothetical protein NCS52_01098400 [Fusarium sp. LHS14.1]
MTLSKILVSGLLATSVSSAALAPQKRASGTATVSLAEPSGTPSHLASGIIYGLPDNGDGSANTDIPESFITGMGLNYCRAGGAQLPDPALGWVAGQYEGRWKSALSNYRTTRKYGGRFTLLMHDPWGADGIQGNEFHWPGDNGNWTSYDAFLDQVFSDIKLYNAIPGLDIDIWNEPDVGGFWGTSQEQYLATWLRTFHRISGPSATEPPTESSPWWQNYMRFIAENDAVPDIYTWHLVRADRNLRESSSQFDELRRRNSLPERPIVINERSPAGGVFYISQFERHNTHGLRANWGSASKLHDLLANLLGKRDGEYYPVGEWHVYNYYKEKMTGERVAVGPGLARTVVVSASSWAAKKERLRIVVIV